MNLEQIKNTIPDYAKDIRLNLVTILSSEGAPGINEVQRLSIALACGYAVKNKDLILSLIEESKEILTDNDRAAAQSSAAIMAMNNIYYRFTHLVSDESYRSMPARLRMNVIGTPGIDKVNFELNCLAISAINGCGLCLDAHTRELLHRGVDKVGIQSAVRIASVIHAAAQSLSMSY